MKKTLLAAFASASLVLSATSFAPMVHAQATACVPSITYPTGLTDCQVDAIRAILLSFGVDSSTLANVDASLRGHLTSTSSSSGHQFCHIFATNLTFGSSGIEVKALNQAFSLTTLTLSDNVDNSVFNKNTAADVTSFQALYGIRQTGYVGTQTRTKLNVLYGCTPETTQTTQSTTVNPRVSSPTITSVNQPVTVNSESTIYLNGSFDGNTVVYWNHNLAINPTFYSTSQISFVVPQGTSSGSYDVQVYEKGNSPTNSVASTITLQVSSSAPSITVTYPNGGESFVAGQTMQIRWNANNAPSGHVASIGLVKTDGTYADTPTQGYCNLAGGCVPLTTGTLNYTIPTNILAGQYKIRVLCWQQNSEASDCSANDYSDNYFSITNTASVAAATPTTTSAPIITINNDSTGSTLNYTLPFGGTVSFTWSVTPSSGTTCAAAGNGINGGSSGYAFTALNGSWTSPPLYTNTTYGIVCKNAAGTMYKYANVSVPTQINTTTVNTVTPTITVNGDSSGSRLSYTLPWGGTKTFTWSVTPSSGTTCAAAGNGIGGGYGIMDLSGTWTTPQLYMNTTYGVACSNKNSSGVTSGTIYKYADITVQAQVNTPAPAITLSTTFSQDSSSTVSGAPIKLYWTSTGAASCSVSIRYDSSGLGVEANYGGWADSGLGNGTNSPASGATMTSGPPGLYQAQLYCNGGSLGTSVKYLTHTVVSPAPTLTLYWNGVDTLTWNQISGAQQYKVYYNGTYLSTSSGPIFYYPGLPAGTYPVRVDAVDASGAVIVSGSLNVVVAYAPTTVRPVASINGASQTASVFNALFGKQDGGTTAATFGYHFDRDLQMGSSYFADVSALQIALMKEGIYSGEVTGGFYSQTFTAVKAFQQKYGIEATGYVGPATRTKLNELYGR